MARKLIFFISFWLIILNLGAQQTFTLQDSLRGFLYPWRAGYDVHYYHLDLEVDPEEQSIAGSNAIHFNVTEKLDSLQIDLYENLRVSSIILNGHPVSYSRLGNAIFIVPDKSLSPGSNHILKINYQGKPIVAANAPWDGGFVWSRNDTGKPWIGVACEGDGASLWWPCKDHLTEEPDSMLISCTVPDPLFCVANGRLRAVDKEDDGKSTYHWFIRNPINSYNVTLNISDYAHFEDEYVSRIDGDTLSLDYYVLPQNLERAKRHFEQVKPMLDCYEGKFGKYPFYEDGYKLVETPYLGMEHQSAIAYGNRYRPGYLGMDLSGLGFDYIIIHETAHEWFGNSISAHDVAELWIHESFTTYSEAIYVECMSNYSTAVNYLNKQKWYIKNQKPVIGPLHVNFQGWGADTDLYYKGSWMLHSLRSWLDNDDKWFEILRKFAITFRKQIVTGEEVFDFFEMETGLELTAFFDQYLRHSAPPVLEYEIRENKRSVTLRYRWKADEKDFQMPVEVKADDKNYRLHPATEWKERTFKSKETPLFDDGRFYYQLQAIQ